SVHPRVRGDLAGQDYVVSIRRGSPPRARGPQVRLPRIRDRARFTPACAGTSTTSGTTRTPSPVHPRVRGDLDEDAAYALTRPGSPPRARGPRELAARAEALGRFTP